MVHSESLRKAIAMYKDFRAGMQYERRSGLSPFYRDVIRSMNNVDAVKYTSGSRIGDTLSPTEAKQVMMQAAREYATGGWSKYEEFIYRIEGVMPWTRATDPADLDGDVLCVHQTVQALLENPSRKHGLRLEIRTSHTTVLYDVGYSDELWPDNNRCSDMDIQFIGRNMSDSNASSNFFKILSGDDTKGQYSNVRSIRLGGAGPQRSGTLNLRLLGWPEFTPDWSQLCMLELYNVILDWEAVEYIRKLSTHITLRNIICIEESMTALAKGSRFTGVRVSGVHVVELPQ
jgi:hypothetical protein